MAAKKYYGVKKGKVTGVFQSWEACKKSIEGFSGAEYKGFGTYEEACAFAGVELVDGATESTGHEQPAESRLHAQNVVADSRASDSLVVYVDGSYNDALPKYAFGCVFLLPDGRIYVEYGNGDNPQSLKHRNVTGEMLGAMYAVRAAMLNGYTAIEICYDYEGIEKWVTGAWRSKTELTQKYAAAMQEWGRNIRITFTKVAAHTNVQYNELADQTAKRGLTEANGVPKVKRFEEMEQV
ncbi:MAG: RNAse H family protein [Lachnospiraceae bacterium]|nr:RNAse H family protein [Lachnospiraceae bacterium]